MQSIWRLLTRTITKKIGGTTAVVAVVLLAGFLAGCGKQGGGGASGDGGGNTPLTVLSASENKSLEPLIQRFEHEKKLMVKMEYLGSVDIMLQLENGAPGYDAVWPANSIWIDLGDRQKKTKSAQGIMRSPVVLGVKKSIAKGLGWIGKDVKVAQILDAAESGKLRMMMTSASQSNSGASAYLGYLYAFAGQPEVLTEKHLTDPKVRGQVRRILGAVNRSAGSSGWLKELFLQKYDRYDAMVNYESVVIEANRELTSKGQEPLYAIYPSDGLAIADSPLAYVDNGDAGKQTAFKELQDYLLSEPIQREIEGLGRRVGLAALSAGPGNTAVFNPDWGIDAQKILSPIRYPPADVLRKALDLYQTAFRKPSYTVYCLDYSGSMKGQAIEDLKSSMRTLLLPDEARRYLLQTSDDDQTVVIPFDHELIDVWSVTGGKPVALQGLWQKVQRQNPRGGTDIYTPVMHAFDRLAQVKGLENYFPAIILMTDGQSNRGADLAALQRHVRSSRIGMDVPVFGILFGDADKTQLQQIADFTSGRVFDGRKDLIRAFREARGYN